MHFIFNSLRPKIYFCPLSIMWRNSSSQQLEVTYLCTDFENFISLLSFFLSGYYLHFLQLYSYDCCPTFIYLLSYCSQ